MIDAVVYDFGGVFMASPFAAIRQLSQAKGYDFDVTLAALFGPYDQDTDHPWHRCERGELDITTARQEIIALAAEQGMELDLFEMLSYLRTSEEDRIYAPMVETVRRARATGAKTAILTNNIVEASGMWQQWLPVDELFDAVVDSSAVGMRKPNPKIYEHTLALLDGATPEGAVFLDDFEGNVRAAEALGWRGIVVGDDREVAIAELDALLAG
jgi:epoxide hydrolase-like predicted phosphatase